jgi:hypothetical protein
MVTITTRLCDVCKCHDPKYIETLMPMKKRYYMGDLKPTIEAEKIDICEKCYNIVFERQPLVLNVRDYEEDIYRLEILPQG